MTEIRETPAIPTDRPLSPEPIADDASSIDSVDLPAIPEAPPPKTPLQKRLTAPIRNRWKNVSNPFDRRPRPSVSTHAGPRDWGMSSRPPRLAADGAPQRWVCVGGWYKTWFGASRAASNT